MNLTSLRTATMAALVVAASAACHHNTAPAPVPARPAPVTTPERRGFTTGEEVIAAMHARYVGRWYSTLTFTQKTGRLGADDKWNVQTWYEAMRIPGRLRIDFDPI